MLRFSASTAKAAFMTAPLSVSYTHLVGKTIGAAVGISPEVLSDQITLGKVVSAALVS